MKKLFTVSALQQLLTIVNKGIHYTKYLTLPIVLYYLEYK
jgi:hypothetical protein